MTLGELALYGVMPILAVAIVLQFIRLVRGPSLPDRVVALDLLTSLGIGIIAAYAIGVDHSALLDVAILMALMSFLSTVAFALYLERRV